MVQNMFPQLAAGLAQQKALQAQQQQMQQMQQMQGQEQPQGLPQQQQQGGQPSNTMTKAAMQSLMAGQTPAL
jgi:hypothetical protein